MKRIYLATLSSLSLSASLLFWQSSGQAEYLCYLVNDEGNTVNLEHLCQEGAEAGAPLPSMEGQPATEPMDESAAEEATPGAVNYTIIGPASDSETDDGDPGEATPLTEDASTEGTESGADDSSTMDESAEPAEPDESADTTPESRSPQPSAVPEIDVPEPSTVPEIQVPGSDTSDDTSPEPAVEDSEDSEPSETSESAEDEDTPSP